MNNRADLLISAVLDEGAVANAALGFAGRHIASMAIGNFTRMVTRPLEKRGKVGLAVAAAAPVVATVAAHRWIKDRQQKQRR